MSKSSLDFGEYNAQGYMPPPPRKPNGGLYTGEQFQTNAPWGNIPVYPTTDYLTHTNLLVGNNPPPGATYQYPGSVRLGNNYQEMPGVSCYCSEENGGAYNILCTPCPPEQSRGCTQENDQQLELSVVEKSRQHPFYGVGSQFTFSVQGREIPHLHLYRGIRYIFRTSPEHSPYIATHPYGRGLFAYREPNQNEQLEFQPNDRTPSIVYLSSLNHSYMSIPVSIVSKHVAPSP